MKVSKYLYISKGSRYGNLPTRISSKRNDIKKGEVCIKLDIDIDNKVFEDIIPTVNLEIPVDYKHRSFNLRVG